MAGSAVSLDGGGWSYSTGPTLFSNTNRTPAVEDVRNVLIYITFTTFFVAFLIIIPGIRKERFSTFICVTISLFIGASILVANFGTSWHVAFAQISSPYRAFSTEKIFADIGVRVGLQSVNISLKATSMHERPEEINYNERFYWIGPSEMKQEYHAALAKGLPFPILTVAEYLSQDGEGFCWGRRYRLAGYYASLMLWAAFAAWLLMNILLCAVPRYGVYMMQATGGVLLATNALYAVLLPRKPLVIPFEGEALSFHYGWCFWLVLAAGVTAVVVGAAVSIVDTLFPNKFSTILEVDYDTPYRYFVGNDAHLFGGAGMANAANHSCPHMIASATSSTATDTTCCGNNSPIGKQLSSKVVSSSVSATFTQGRKRKSVGDRPTNDKTVTSTTATTLIAMPDIEEMSLTTTTTTVQVSAGVENKAFTADEDVSDGGSEVSTSMVDGKRAISLHNFGKFADQQKARGLAANGQQLTPN